MKNLVIYHADCADGFGAAYAAWLSICDSAEYLPMHYKDELNVPVEGRNVYILDFSFPLDVMETICDKASNVIWLDHHATSKETAAQIASNYPSAYVKHSDTKSGSILAWEYFHPFRDVPSLISHIDDRARWQFKLRDTKAVSAALWSYRPWTFEAWNDYTSKTMYSQLITEGAAILRAQRAEVEATVKKAYPIHIAGQVGLAVNTDTNISEVCQELANQSETFGVVWYFDEGTSVKYSLRSNGDFDVSKIAEFYDGGWHKNAAWFVVSVEELATLMRTPK